MRRSTHALTALAALAAFAACSGAPLAPPPSPAPAPSPTAPPPRLGLLDDEPAAERSAEAAPAGPLPASSGRFEPVPLPPNLPAIVAVAGRSGRDVWMVAKGGSVLHWDGARTTDRGAPSCFTDSCCGTLFDCKRQPAMCTKAAAENCQPFGRSCAMAVEFDSLRLTPDDVVVSALVSTGGLRASLVESRMRRDGRWSCEQSSGDLIYPGARGRGDVARALELSVGGASIRFEGPAVLVNHLGGYILVVDGRRVSLPEGARQQGAGGTSYGLAARSPDDLWLWSSEGGRVWRGNGLAWYPLRTGLETVAEIWFADPGSAWVLGAVEKEGSEQLIRWDLDKGAGQRFATPGATDVLKGGGHDFWLVGKKALYAWDGRELRRAETPLEVEQSWRSPSGEIWVVGADRTAKVKTTEGSGPAGAAFRMPVEKGEPPKPPAQPAPGGQKP